MEMEMATRMRALEEQNVKMQEQNQKVLEQNARLMAKMEEMLQRGDR